jgi:hypothetical protein
MQHARGTQVLRHAVVLAGGAVELDGNAVGHEPHGVLDSLVAQWIESTDLDERRGKAGERLGTVGGCLRGRIGAIDVGAEVRVPHARLRRDGAVPKLRASRWSGQRARRN